MVRPAARREVAGHLQVVYGISERRACPSTGFGRSSQRYRKRSDPSVALRMRLKELAAARVRCGYRRLHILSRREGWEVNHSQASPRMRATHLDRDVAHVAGNAWRYPLRVTHGVVSDAKGRAIRMIGAMLDLGKLTVAAVVVARERHPPSAVHIRCEELAARR